MRGQVGAEQFARVKTSLTVLLDESYYCEVIFVLILLLIVRVCLHFFIDTFSVQAGSELESLPNRTKDAPALSLWHRKPYILSLLFVSFLFVKLRAHLAHLYRNPLVYPRVLTVPSVLRGFCTVLAGRYGCAVQRRWCLNGPQNWSL